MKPSTISAVIITFNEEEKIERCLLSLLPVADEIIVLDSFSTDGTEAICSHYKVRFVQQSFLGYIEQKNLAASFATMDYVLSLDADEALSPSLQQWIEKQKITGFQSDAYVFNRLNNYCGQWINHGDYYPDRKLRLWRNGVGTWGGYNPHDKFEVPDWASVSIIKYNLLHWSFSTRTEHVQQMKKFSRMAAASYFSQHKRAGALKPYLSACWSFLSGFFLKLGFLDGINGWHIAVLNAKYTFWKYRHLQTIQKGMQE